MRVTCPNCGPRLYTEFWFGGELLPHDAHAVPGAEALAADFDRVWLRTNLAGLQSERWFHHAGCRRWFVTERDTLTNHFPGRE